MHSKLRMEKADMTRRMIAAVENPHVDILGHCTGRRIVGRPRPQSSFDHEAVFAACAASGTAVEVNSRPDRRDPPEELLRAAAAAGCQFSIDSDAHAPGQLSWLRLGCEQAVEAGVPLNRLSTRSRSGSSWPGRPATNGWFTKGAGVRRARVPSIWQPRGLVPAAYQLANGTAIWLLRCDNPHISNVFAYNYNGGSAFPVHRRRLLTRSTFRMLTSTVALPGSTSRHLAKRATRPPSR